MSQSLPAQRGSTYALSIWAKARGMSEGAVELRVDAGEKPRRLVLPAGTWDWRKLSIQIPGNADSINIQIRCKGAGEAWIDDILFDRVL